MSDKQENDEFGVWAVVELMGHVKVAGFVTEQVLFGTTVGRIDIPAGDGEAPLTQYFGGSTLYRLTPTTEQLARAFAKGNRPRPVSRFELVAPRVEQADDWDYGVEVEPEDMF